MHEFLELKTESEWSQAFQVLRELRQGLTVDKFLADRERLLRDGFRLFGLQADGRICSVASAHVYPHVSHGSDCWVHDLATSQNDRGNGYGEALMRHIEGVASSLGCSRALVHTGNSRAHAQNFYANHLGYDRYAVVFQKKLK